ncbi:MAG: tetratricopeptide repeat protein [Chitinophagaceae bacterium]|nr:tetratricopeptide repeat protein [Chitinophagaceae bacterium]
MHKPMFIKISFVLLLIVSSCFVQAQLTCANDAPASLRSNNKTLLAKLDTARKQYLQDSTNADKLIWLGRRLAYVGRYQEAIAVFTKGIERFPKDARMLRHRGHRYLSLRCIDKAIVDFEAAAKLVKGKPDEVEPDGLPNAQNIPTSTLQTNIYYHLGLAHYLQKNYAAAEKAYQQSLKLSKNPDMYVATAYWQYLTLRHQQKDKAAAKLLNTIKPNMPLIENEDYYALLQLFQQKPLIKDPADMLEQKKELSLVSYGYGLGEYCWLSGQTDFAKAVWQTVLQSSQWSAFGYLAATVALMR